MPVCISVTYRGTCTLTHGHALKTQRGGYINLKVCRAGIPWKGEIGTFHDNVLFNKDTGWEIWSVSVCGMQPLHVIYKCAAQLLHYRP